jgi:hypothetical protein
VRNAARDEVQHAGNRGWPAGWLILHGTRQSRNQVAGRRPPSNNGKIRPRCDKDAGFHDLHSTINYYQQNHVRTRPCAFFSSDSLDRYRGERILLCWPPAARWHANGLGQGRFHMTSSHIHYNVGNARFAAYETNGKSARGNDGGSSLLFLARPYHPAMVVPKCLCQSGDSLLELSKFAQRGRRTRRVDIPALSSFASGRVELN